MNFDYSFWVNEFTRLEYPVEEKKLDISYLREQGILSRSVESAKLLYRDDYVELAVLIQRDGLSRAVCSRTARKWKERRMIRPLLVFTNYVDSYLVIVPGPGVGGEARILWLHGELYRTDREVLESIKYRGDPQRLKEAYDNKFLPYEKVREEFFEGYRALFEKITASAKRVLKFEAQSYAQRFLGRLMFLYFLQRKGWLKGDRHFIDKIRDYSELNAIFYESLNKENGEEGIPFLNGSLFEKERYMTREVEARLIPIMDPLFCEAREFFNRYNFTVDETSPLEVEVSVDPLLLGTVLENLLPMHERGSKGTFYTPVDEIGFMCRRALATWLGLKDDVNNVQDGGVKFVDGLSRYLEELKSRKSKKEIREFRDKLLSAKILDPAVGSGGFLIVMMQTILQAIIDVEESVGWKSDVEQYKRRIISNLYGFDIEPEAVEIARLRIWLSLIVDQREPEPLPNLDMNIIKIEDSLTVPKGVQLRMDLYTDEEFKTLTEDLARVKEKYLIEHKAEEKQRLRRRIDELQEKIAKKTGMKSDGLPVEFYMPTLADITVMNPPYVRHKKIPKSKKDEYVSIYKIDRTSDLYAYFMVRILRLLREDGAAALITSDKWLEVNYGATLQSVLKHHLVAIYGQRRRSFTADINTVVTVLTKKQQPGESPIRFIYLESYKGEVVRNYKAMSRDQLHPGKWYYLRAPRIFEEVLLPKLTHRLKDFAEIKRGFTTGANEFFYMKDITHLYTVDYLSNQEKFKEWGVNAKTVKELEEQKLIYVENGVRDQNGAKFRFVINTKDVIRLVKSPKEIKRYRLVEPALLCLYTSNPAMLTRKYITWGENFNHKEDDTEYEGFHEHPTCSGRRPWYKLPDLKPSRILLPMHLRSRLFFALADEPVLCDAALYTLYPKCGTSYEKLFCYLNSTLFLLTLELYGMRMGGGGGELQIKVNFYEGMPVPDLSKLTVEFDHNRMLSRNPLRFDKEVKQPDRHELDKAVLRALDYREEDLERLVDELHRAFVEVVEDRLIKAVRPIEIETEES